MSNDDRLLEKINIEMGEQREELTARCEVERETLVEVLGELRSRMDERSELTERIHIDSGKLTETREALDAIQEELNALRSRVPNLEAAQLLTKEETASALAKPTTRDRSS